IGIIALMASVSNVPAILGFVAAYVLYVVYKKWNENKEIVKEESDPFVNFEKQWAELKRN
ncbi:MAG TPA: flagellar basal body rod protein, partial [Bacillus sp. (in: firmicutes)]|nr:flagellar basal body rod protein [Bacillus sp. (in: firmicutes)]